MQNSRPSKILLLITIAAVALALYFGIENYKLIKLQTAYVETRGENPTTKLEDNVAKIDALLLNGDYVNALSMSEELKATQNIELNTELDLRVKIAKDFVALSKKNKATVAQISKTVVHSSSENNSNSSVNNIDTTPELEQAMLEIKSLKNRLSNNSNSYITFQTSKGTNLHYVGRVKNDKANGYGIAILETGSRYEGQWKDGMRHGKGKFYWNDGEDYDGDYRNDMREGFGTYHWSNGEKYVGEWKNDRRNGHGEFFNKRGKLKNSGTWEDDKLVEED